MRKNTQEGTILKGYFPDNVMETGRFRGSLSELYQCVHSVKKIFFRKNTYHIFNLLFLILMAHGSCELHVQFLQFASLFGIFTVQVLWLGGVFGQILTKRSHKSFELFKLWFPVIQSIESTCKFGLKLIIFITSKILRSNPGISRIFGLNSGIFSFFILDYSKKPRISIYIEVNWGQNMPWIFTYSVWRAFLLTFSCEASFRYSDNSPSSCWTFWLADSACFWLSWTVV